MKKVQTRFKNIINMLKALLSAAMTDCPYTPPTDEPAADVSVLRASVSRYFKYNQADLLYVLPYEPMYEQAIDGIREDGWQVALHASASGELFYTITAKPKKESAA